MEIWVIFVAALAGIIFFVGVVWVRTVRRERFEEEERNRPFDGKLHAPLPKLFGLDGDLAITFVSVMASSLISTTTAYILAKL